MTNQEVRGWYLQEVASIPALDQKWQSDGLSLPDRARRAWEIRHRARVAARTLMTDPLEVDMLGRRDSAKYGNPDGPTFEQLFDQAKAKGLNDDRAYQEILSSSTATDHTTNRKFSQ